MAATLFSSDSWSIWRNKRIKIIAKKEISIVSTILAEEEQPMMFVCISSSLGTMYNFLKILLS